eukprot:COSAG05_NODE_782_length_7373_cov_4.015122_3_plen_129_part_00
MWTIPAREAEIDALRLVLFRLSNPLPPSANGLLELEEDSPQKKKAPAGKGSKKKKEEPAGPPPPPRSYRCIKATDLKDNDGKKAKKLGKIAVGQKVQVLLLLPPLPLRNWPQKQLLSLQVSVVCVPLR